MPLFIRLHTVGNSKQSAHFSQQLLIRLVAPLKSHAPDLELSSATSKRVNNNAGIYCVQSLLANGRTYRTEQLVRKTGIPKMLHKNKMTGL